MIANENFSFWVLGVFKSKRNIILLIELNVVFYWQKKNLFFYVLVVEIFWVVGA